MAGFLSELCSVDKVIIGGVHLLPLPGTPDYDLSGGMEKIYRRAREDVLRLSEARVDAILFANESDAPYQTKVGAEIVAAMTYCIGRLKGELAVPFGINMLLDPLAGIAVAHATGGKFVRGYYTGGYVGDMGIMNTCGPEAARFRKALGAEDVRFITNLTCAFGVPLAQRDLTATAYGAVVHGRVDALAVSGPAAGFEADREALAAVRRAVADIPVLVGTGVSLENVRDMLAVADGAIVASALKVDGVTLNPVDGERAKRFMAAVRAFREEVGSSGKAS
ncbi:MAG: BtpA/SgcQ family protein [Methanocella sp.]